MDIEQLEDRIEMSLLYGQFCATISRNLILLFGTATVEITWNYIYFLFGFMKIFVTHINVYGYQCFLSVILNIANHNQRGTLFLFSSIYLLIP